MLCFFFLELFFTLSKNLFKIFVLGDSILVLLNLLSQLCLKLVLLDFKLFFHIFPSLFLMIEVIFFSF